MRILGIDYGTKRIGIAVSDEAAQFALPHSVIPNSGSLLEGITDQIMAIAASSGADTAVLGESNDYKGNANPVMAAATALKGKLEGKGLTVILEPEFMTSANAERFQGKTDMHDASAAALILQSYLDKKNSQHDA